MYTSILQQQYIYLLYKVSGTNYISDISRFKSGL
jgi:hypothetical protein